MTVNNNETWKKDLSESNETGDGKDENICVLLEWGLLRRPLPYIKVPTGPCLSFVVGSEKKILENPREMKEEEPQETLRLTNVTIPKDLRNKGIFKEILDFVELRAKQEKKHLFVGLLTTEDSKWIQKVCESRGYLYCTKEGYIKLYN